VHRQIETFDIRQRGEFKSASDRKRTARSQEEEEEEEEEEVAVEDGGTEDVKQVKRVKRSLEEEIDET